MGIRIRRIESDSKAAHGELMRRFARAGVPRASITNRGDFGGAMKRVLDGILHDMGMDDQKRKGLTESPVSDIDYQ